MRLLNDKSRPLIGHLEKEEDVKEFIAKHLFERSYFYNKANYKIDASKDVEEITEHLLFKLF